MAFQPALVWFRNDLRLTDNPALHAAALSGRPVVALYVLDDVSEGLRPIGGAARWWLDKSLRALSEALSEIGGTLTLRRGPARNVVSDVVAETGAKAVYWNRRYGEAERQLDASIKEALKAGGTEVTSFNGSLLTEPWALRTSSGGYYRVFTPYWKAVRAGYCAPQSLGRPRRIDGIAAASDPIADWGLHPGNPDWSGGFGPVWTPGEAGAQARLSHFLEHGIARYDEARNRPDIDGTSRLSPHLRWGEIGPAEIWRAVEARFGNEAREGGGPTSFLSEIVWREFSHVLLYHNPRLHDENYNRDFGHMPWRDSAADYRCWTRGQTGYPIVDAGMRQLWHTGWMHNRVRMIVGSFLTKHLLIDWRDGEAWFWDTLVDADAASNASGWQWVAGSGADAAPYFRVFNPITQGEKFDESGDYVRRWCPELKNLPRRHLYAPWTAPQSMLQKAGVVLGESWPHPVIEHKAGRERALSAYETLKERRNAA